MIENIAVVGLCREQAYEVGKMLAVELDMHFFDCIELFEFDNVPRNLTIMLRDLGEKYYRQKEKGMLKYVSGFNETVINLEAGMCSKENFKTIKSNCLLVYLHSPLSVVRKRLAKAKYRSKEEKKFFCISDEKIEKRIMKYKANADIIVQATHGSALKLSSEVLRKIKAFYNYK